MSLLEQSYKRCVIDSVENAGGWAEAIQPGLGGKTGLPDVMIQERCSGVSLWELKRGSVFSGVLLVEDIRPAQLRWSMKFHKFGGVVGFCCGVKTSVGWMSYLLKMPDVWRWQETFTIGVDCQMIKTCDMGKRYVQTIFK